MPGIEEGEVLPARNHHEEILKGVKVQHPSSLPVADPDIEELTLEKTPMVEDEAWDEGGDIDDDEEEMRSG